MTDSASSPSAEPAPGRRFGRYAIVGVLGKGGMGHVFRAVSDDGETVALKVIRPDLRADASFGSRFRRESRSAARVHHPHVVPFVDAGEQNGFAYLAERFIPGGTLEQRLGRTAPLPISAVVQLCRDVGGGLDAIHGAGLVHRDLKPANILLGEDGAAYVGDLGLVKDPRATALTGLGQALGSVQYMAPEQVRGADVGPAADVYALGCVVYECLAGHPPFAGHSGMRMLWAHLREEPPDPAADRADAPPSLGWAVMRALQKDPAERPPTATAYARLVEVAARGLPLHASSEER